jgi:hypothetical protein
MEDFLKRRALKRLGTKKTRLFFFLSAPMGIHPGARAFLSFFRLKTMTPTSWVALEGFHWAFSDGSANHPRGISGKSCVEKDTFR